MPVSDDINKQENCRPLDPPPEDTGFVRETSLTDKLNKKLLESFLVHINNSAEQTQEISEDNNASEFA